MEDLKLEYGEEGIRSVKIGTDMNPTPFLYAASKNVNVFYRFDRQGVEALYAWLTQWLKENPVQQEGWFLDCGGPFTYMFRSRGELDEHLLKFPQLTPEAIISISYHIGQGLEEEDE